MARMRLRQTARPTIGADWVQPRGSGRATAIGTIDSGVQATVDPAGLVTLEGATWSLDWWVGAEDRWHLPSAEVAVRQSLVGSSPVVETRLRVPSGDAVHRAYAARGADGREAIVVEVENRSKVPFAVAVAVRPYDHAGTGAAEQIAVEGTDLRVDGSVVQLPKSPGRLALSTFANGDVAEVVFRGDAEAPGAAEVRCADGLATGALLFPLAHTALMRIVVPVDPAAPVAADTLPSAEQVAAGWASHAAAGARIDVPDRRLRDGVAASVRHVLLGGTGPEEAAALDEMGCAAQASRILLADPLSLARHPSPREALHAIVRHWELTRDDEVARSLVPVVAALVPRLRRSDAADGSVARAALVGAATMLAALGEDRAALDVWAALPAEVLPAAAGDLGSLLSSAGSTWTWASGGTGQDLRPNAALVRGARALLLAEEVDHLALAPVVADSWLGQGWELHDAPTRFGRISYAVRWHGDRPALLWDVVRHLASDDVRLTAPVLDPAWSTTEAKGEALLAPVPIPERVARRGLTIPVTIEPGPRQAP